MGRPRVVENHPKRTEIEKALMVAKPNYSALSRQFGTSRDVLREYRRAFISAPVQQVLAEAAQAREEVPVMARDVLAKMDLLLDRGYRMLAAADEWLADPNAPGRYNLNPRSHEIDIVVERQVGDRVVRSTEKLGKLIKDVEQGLGLTVVRAESKVADPRKLLLEAVSTLKPVVELLGKATGQIKPEGTNVNVAIVDPVGMLRAATLAAEERRAAVVLPVRTPAPALEGDRVAPLGEGEPRGWTASPGRPRPAVAPLNRIET